MERGTQRRFFRKIDGGRNQIWPEIEVPPFSRELRPQFHGGNLAGVQSVPGPLYASSYGLLKPASLVIKAITYIILVR